MTFPQMKISFEIFNFRNCFQFLSCNWSNYLIEVQQSNSGPRQRDHFMLFCHVVA